MTEIVRRVPGTARFDTVREVSRRLHDLPGVCSVEVGETWTELVVSVRADLSGSELDAVLDLALPHRQT